MTSKPAAILPDFPFESHYAEILGHRMHYIDEGLGDPILLLHGNPTSSYLWRNIIPHLTPCGRCIAPDLMGMGKSDKPGGEYRFLDHYRYIEAFIEKLELRNITFVIHDWGSGLGFHFAAHHPERIKAIAFMEAFLQPVRWSMIPRRFKMGFKLMRAPGIGWILVSLLNFFVEIILPAATVRKLTPKEMEHYRAPFKTIASRKPVRQWPLEIPIEGKPEDMHKIVSSYAEALQKSAYPKLLLHAQPGGLITMQGVDWCKKHLKELTLADIGPGIHYVQEDNPHGIGRAIANWYRTL